MANALTQLQNTLDDLISQLSSFSAEEFNELPFENSWTAAQVGEHLRKSNLTAPSLLSGHTEPTLRNPEEKIEMLKNIFLDFSQKYSAREFNTPETKVYEKDDLIQELSRLKDETLTAAKNLDIRRTCSGFDFPVFGYLTGSELIHLIIYHTQRHIRQLQNIREKLREKQANKIVD